MGNNMDTASQTEILKVIYVAAFVLALVIFCIVYILMKAQRKITEEQESRITAEIDTLENERKRIASDIHDELGPMLSAVKMQVNHLEPSDEIDRNIQQKSSSQIDEIIRRFREISYNLLPNTLVRKGLISAVDEFVNRLGESGKMMVEFIYSDGLVIPKEKEIDIFRIVQEITHNTIKHSQADKLQIGMQKINEGLFLRTTDNGVGFDYDDKSVNANGLGLLNLQSRVAKLHAKMEVVSSRGKGVTYEIIIPL